MAEWKTLLSVVGTSFAGIGEFAYFWSYSLFRDNGVYIAMTNDGKSADLKSDNNGAFVIDCPAGRILECVGPKTGNTIYYYDDPASQMGCDLMISQND